MAGHGGDSRARQREHAAADAFVRAQRVRQLEQQRVVRDDALRAYRDRVFDGGACDVERDDGGGHLPRGAGVDGRPVAVPRLGERGREQGIQIGADFSEGRHDGFLFLSV